MCLLGLQNQVSTLFPLRRQHAADVVTSGRQNKMFAFLRTRSSDISQFAAMIKKLLQKQAKDTMLLTYERNSSNTSVPFSHRELFHSSLLYIITANNLFIKLTI